MPSLTRPLLERPVYSEDAKRILAALDTRIDATEMRVRHSRPWRIAIGLDTPVDVLRALLAEIMLAVAQYQRLTTEAGFTMIGRLPKHEHKLIASLAAHKAEEAEHGEWARRDFLLLGGDPARLEEPASAATFAVSAVWERLASAENPLAYLGAEYLFECLTMRVAPAVCAALRAKSVHDADCAFMVEHATDDVRHTNLISHWVLDVASRYPTSGDDMLRAYDYFEAVYPLPVWTEAAARVDGNLSLGVASSRD